MKRQRNISRDAPVITWLMIAVALAAAPSAFVHANKPADRYRLSDAAQMPKSTGGTYRLDVFTIDGGGGSSVSPDARYRLQGTAGQSDAQAAAASPRYRLQGGLWPEGGPAGISIFKSSFENP